MQPVDRAYRAVRIDGDLLTDFNVYATDLRAVQQSCERPGSHFILTCWCGQPECVGLRSGINVWHDRDIIRWRITQPLPDRTVIFKRVDYEAAYRQCLKKGKRLIETRRYITTKPFSITPDANEAFFALK